MALAQLMAAASRTGGTPGKVEADISQLGIIFGQVFVKFKSTFSLHSSSQLFGAALSHFLHTSETYIQDLSVIKCECFFL